MRFRKPAPQHDAPEIRAVHAYLPVRIGSRAAETTFAMPLERRMKAAGLGLVEDCRPRLAEDGEIGGLDLFLGLTDQSDDAIHSVGTILESLGAPRGSRLRAVEGGAEITFGQTAGMAVYVKPRHVRAPDRAERIARLCIDAIGGAARYHAKDDVANHMALYFYGDSLRRMKDGLDRVQPRHPALKDAVARRLT